MPEGERAGRIEGATHLANGPMRRYFSRNMSESATATWTGRGGNRQATKKPLAAPSRPVFDRKSASRTFVLSLSLRLCLPLCLSLGEGGVSVGNARVCLRAHNAGSTLLGAASRYTTDLAKTTRGLTGLGSSMGFLLAFFIRPRSCCFASFASRCCGQQERSRCR